jgi:anti-sigma regulatory factor (Ser/Thr protein kinase)
VLTLDTGELVYSSAGHPPPVLAYADGTTTMLEGGLGLPLALRPGRSRPEAVATVPARATVLLYTDGLVERRGRSLDDGMALAAELVKEGRATSLDAVAEHLMDTLEPGGGYPDDVALLLYRQPAPLVMSFVADVAELAPSRNALRAWLIRAGVEFDQIQDVLVAAGEAVSNAIEHGHRELPDGTVSLRASAAADQLHVTVTDRGTWTPPGALADVSRGRGMTLMRALMNEMTIHTDNVGTTVDLYARII